jgi:oligoribonuclease (3'-5' exoribonuclease)
VARLHYRQLDVSALKILWLGAGRGPEFKKEDAALVQQYLPGWNMPAQAQRHDALYDVLCSIAELNYYRQHFLRT